jgi:uncharacterized protein YfaS (alpha-2-macroglobulin family)
VRLPAKDPKLLITAASGSDTALVDTDFYSTLAIAPDVFIYSDRPIYRPGDEINFRGLVRKPDSFLSRLFVPAGRSVEVKLGIGGDQHISVSTEVDEFGSFSGKLAVPEDAQAGVVRLVAEVAKGEHQSEVRVQDYVKPTFYVELQSDQETVEPGKTLEAKIRARRYDGGPMEEGRYEVFLYRSLLDSPAWVDDAGMGGKGSAVTYGSASSNEGKLSVPERLYSSVSARSQNQAESGEDSDSWESAPTLDENGEANIQIPVPPLTADDERLPYRYTLSVRVRDDQQTFANATRAFFLAPSEVMAALRPSTAVTKKGTQPALSVRATTLSGRPYGQTAGSVEFVLRDADGDEKTISKTSIQTGGDGIWRGPMPAPSAGTVIARVTLNDKAGNPWTGETSLLVVGDSGEESVRVPSLSVASLTDTAVPGDTAELVALFPSGWGPGGKDKGKAWLTLSGTGIFETRVIDISGLSFVYRFEVERRFGSAVYVSLSYPTAAGRWEERTANFRIVPPERILNVAIEARRPEAQPLGPQTLDLTVTDHRGRGVTAQVSIGVVDKAVYAVQGEFRPRALDFFYPLVRDNVSTFTSAEFQGYGYGEMLARALSRPGYAFAAVKPPTKIRETDTAYWSPNVVTDSDGHATVDFKLPSNQTLWTVTAVAADASGRFGEGTSEFASRGKMNLVASVPQFLREGDEARGSVRVARNEAKGAAVKLDVRLAASGALKEEQRKEVLDLLPRGEKIVAVDLRAAKVGTGKLAISMTGGPSPLSDQRLVPIRDSSVQETLYAGAWGGGKLELVVPAGAVVEEVRLSLRPSTVAVALANLEDLLVYPYGCLEQLVATTVPNLAVYRVLEKAGALDRLDAPGQALLSEARSRAVQGTQRILALGVKGGGFTWFSGYDTPSTPLTLIALDGLSYAVEAGLLSRDDPRIVGSAKWLSQQQDLPLALDATRAYVLARLQGRAQAAEVRAFIERASGSGSLHAAAMAALAAEQAGVFKEPQTREKVLALVAQAEDGFVRSAVLKPEPDAFFQYPLRRAGFTAILGHAASLGGKVDLATARRRLVDALGDGSDLSTFERSTALLHSLWLIERDAKEMRQMSPPKVDVTGGSAAKLAPRGAGLAARLDPATRGVQVASFEGQAVLEARVRLPLGSVHARSEGMSLTRSYYLLTPSGKKPLESGKAVRQGDEVYVELTLDAHDNDRGLSLRSAYYVLEDPVPAGFTVLGEDKVYRGEPYNLPLEHEALKRRSLNPERALFFFEEPTFWSRSPRAVGYVLRAQFPGRFAAPPATVVDMYAPKVRGRSEPASLGIAAK